MNYRLPSQIFSIEEDLIPMMEAAVNIVMSGLVSNECNIIECNPPYSECEEGEAGCFSGLWFSPHKLDFIIDKDGGIGVVVPGFNTEGDHCVDFPVMKFLPEAYENLIIKPFPAFGMPVAEA